MEVELNDRSLARACESVAQLYSPLTSLLTNELTQTFIHIYIYIPPYVSLANRNVIQVAYIHIRTRYYSLDTTNYDQYRKCLFEK